MKIVIFGLTISSSWGNGHATLWRGLCNALAREGHRVVFFEHDVPYYANTRDWNTLPGGDLVLYADWAAVRTRAAREIADADVAIVTSYCPHALDARAAIADAQRPLAVFYDLDTPVTLAALARGDSIPYLDADGLRAYDLVLSYTGGPALAALREQLGARCVQPLYGHVDPDVHRPTACNERYRADLSWLGTYAADRQHMLERLFVQPARQQPSRRFLIAGAQYPAEFPWCANVYFVRHLPPNEHAAFMSSSRLTLNVTREAMAAAGWCPSGRLFEAAACGAAILSDSWQGLGEFYGPGTEILVAFSTGDALAALELEDAQLRRIGRAARERTLEEHTSQRRARQMIDLFEQSSATRARHLSLPPIGPELASCGA
jgi:spore maturation protein CgeB